MPWLIKDAETPVENLFFVHVPRCGGTSLSTHFKVNEQCIKGCNLWHKMGMLYFFYRYRLLETANFPIWAWETLIATCQFCVAICLFIAAEETSFVRREGHRFTRFPIIAYTFLVSGTFLLVSSTFLFTAPFIGRVALIRKFYLILVHYILFRAMESTDWCTGTNIKGYMMHLTMPKLLQYGYVTPERMEEVCTMAIVRNPYSRMVSVFQYNKFGPAESFKRFVKDYYKTMRHYRERGEMEETHTPCHGIPQFEFTHHEGKQIVQSVVMQEELKLLFTKSKAEEAIASGSSVGKLPPVVRAALVGMPHTNKRAGNMRWFEHYDQETLDITYEMYKHDFQVFGYSPELKDRPDLKSPVPEPVDDGTEIFQRNSKPPSSLLVMASSRRGSLVGSSVCPSLDMSMTSPVGTRVVSPGRDDQPELKTLSVVLQGDSDANSDTMSMQASAQNSYQNLPIARSASMTSAAPSSSSLPTSTTLFSTSTASFPAGPCIQESRSADAEEINAGIDGKVDWKIKEAEIEEMNARVDGKIQGKGGRKIKEKVKEEINAEVDREVKGEDNV